MNDTERIREVLPVKIPAQLSGGDSIVRNLLLRDQAFLDSIVGADIEDLISGFPKRGEKGDIRCDMAGCSAAGQYNSFSHTGNCLSLRIVFFPYILPLYEN